MAEGDKSGNVGVDVFAGHEVGVLSHPIGGAVADSRGGRRLRPLLRWRHRNCQMCGTCQDSSTAVQEQLNTRYDIWGFVLYCQALCLDVKLPSGETSKTVL